MGDGVRPGQKIPEQESPSSPKTYSEIFHEAFPHYLMMNMTPEQFWDGESWLVRDYREAYKMRITQEYKNRDETAWRIGMYIRQALQSTYLLVNGFLPKGVHADKYPGLPFSVQEEERKREEKRIAAEAKKKRDEEERSKEAMALFQAMASKINRNLAAKKLEEKLNSIPYGRT